MNKYLFFLILISSAVSAQRGPGNMDLYQNEAYAQMVDSMSLDPEQKQQFDALEAQLRKTRREKMMAAREEGGDRASMREEMEKLQEGHRSVLSSILTESQMKIYLDYTEEVEKKRRARRGGG